MPYSFDLTGKVAVVTGGTGALGSGFAKALAAAGASVAVLGRHVFNADLVVQEILEAGGTAVPVVADVTDRLSLSAAHAVIRGELGPCDILVNGAGGNNAAATTQDETYADDHAGGNTPGFFDLKADAIQNVFDLNFLGTLLPTQEFALDMVERRRGCIINISSMNAYRPLTKIPAYSGAKAAVSNLTEWLAVHFAASGIRVNAIAPGFFAGKQNHSLLFQADGSLTARSKKILGNTPMGRFGDAEELAGILLFLASDEAAGFITGTVIPVDGGFAAYSGV